MLTVYPILHAKHNQYKYMYTIIIIIGIVVLGITLSLAYLPRPDHPRRLDALFKFFLTLIATLTGVFLAFQISSHQEMLQEKNFLKGLMEQSASGLQSDIDYIETNYLPYLEDKADVGEFEQLINMHPLQGNISLGIILNSTLLPQFASSGYTEINTLVLNLQNYRDSINAHNVAPTARLGFITPYLENMRHLRECLLTEISYISGDISGEEARKTYDELQPD